MTRREAIVEFHRRYPQNPLKHDKDVATTRPSMPANLQCAIGKIMHGTTAYWLGVGATWEEAFENARNNIPSAWCPVWAFKPVPMPPVHGWNDMMTLLWRELETAEQNTQSVRNRIAAHLKLPH